MKSIRPFLDLLKGKVSEADIFYDEVLRENTRRVSLLSVLVVPLSIIHIILFWLQLDTSDSVEYTWRLWIIRSHSLILAVLAVVFFILYLNRHHVLPRLFSVFTVQFVTVFFLLIGAIIVSIDQMVTVAITPFIITCIVAGLATFIRPVFSFVYYLVAYLAFYFLLGQTQIDPDILISNRVNGITICIFGFGLSVILWNMNLVRFKQQRLINKQKQELEENYSKLMFYANELKVSNTTKDKLFSIIGHDLKSPFNAILGYTQLLSENIDSFSPEEIKDISASINYKSGQAFELLNNLLDWSRTQLKKLEAKPEKLLAEPLVGNVLSLVSNLNKLKNIHLESAIEPGLEVFADETMGQAILRNLLTNAVKFTPSSGQIKVTAETDGEFAIFKIKDSGTGIKPEILNQIFNIDQGNLAAGTNNEKGTGLGLQICKEFVEMNGGKIWVESELGAGSTFFFTLPLYKK